MYRIRTGETQTSLELLRLTEEQGDALEDVFGSAASLADDDDDDGDNDNDNDCNNDDGNDGNRYREHHGDRSGSSGGRSRRERAIGRAMSKLRARAMVSQETQHDITSTSKVNYLIDIRITCILSRLFTCLTYQHLDLSTSSPPPLPPSPSFSSLQRPSARRRPSGPNSLHARSRSACTRTWPWCRL